MFNDLLDETEGFKYQNTVKIFFKKCKSTEIVFSPVYFSSTTKTVVNRKFDLEKDFQEVLYSIERWINEGSGWIIKSINSQLISISTFRPLSGSPYIKLSVEFRNSKKGLINIKNNDQNVFFGVILDMLI